MKKRDRIIYWVATIWLSLGMMVSGVAQLLQTEQEVELFTKLGYPAYFMIILGIWKVLGVISVLIPKFPLVKEWAYAGFFLSMSGATISHLAAGSPPVELIGPLLLIVLTIVSWYFRPAGRRLP